MRIILDVAGYVVAKGDVASYAYEAPAFIANDPQWFLWKWNLIGDISIQASWAKTPLPPMSVVDIVDDDQAFCAGLIKNLFVQLRLQSMTNTQRLSLLGTIQTGMLALCCGDAEVARGAFNGINTNALWTQARKDWVLLQIDNYLTQ